MGYLNHHQREHRRHFAPHCCTDIISTSQVVWLAATLCVEHFPLQWQTTISLIAVGTGNSSVACGFGIPSSSLVYPFCKGLMNSCLPGHTLWFAHELFMCTVLVHPLLEEVYHFLPCVYYQSNFLGGLSSRIAARSTEDSQLMSSM